MKKFIRIVLLLLILFVLVGVSAAFLRPSSIISKKDAKARFALPESHFLGWRGGDVHYVDEGSGYPILMIHGLAGSHRNFGRIAERLKKDYRVIRIDLPGFGLSDLPTPPNDDYRQLYMDFSCDYSFLSRSTANTKETIVWEDGKEYPLVKLEISNQSHPFFTGKMKFIDSAGRIEKFQKKYQKKETPQ